MANRKRSSIHAPIIIIAFLGLIVCCAVISFVGPRLRGLEPQTTAFPVLSIMRTVSIPDCRDARFSSSNHVLVQRAECVVDVCSPFGNKLFSVELPVGSRSVLSANGDYLMVYRERNPADSRVEFYDSTGAKAWEMEVDGAVWSADSCVTEDGARFVIGTSKSYVYVVDLADKDRRYKRWRMRGAVVSLAVDADGDGVYAASWQDSFVRCASVRGKVRWRAEMEPTQLHHVRPLPGSGRVLVCSEPLDPDEPASYKLFDKAGETLLSGELDARQNTCIVPAPNGSFICLGISKMIRHKGASMMERHAQLVDESGAVLWEKGSSFFSAVPVAVTPQGCAIISDGKRGLFLVSPAGEIRPSLKLKSPVRDFAVSADGSRILALCADRCLVLINVTQ